MHWAITCNMLFFLQGIFSGSFFCLHSNVPRHQENHANSRLRIHSQNTAPVLSKCRPVMLKNAIPLKYVIIPCFKWSNTCRFPNSLWYTYKQTPLWPSERQWIFCESCCQIPHHGSMNILDHTVVIAKTHNWSYAKSRQRNYWGHNVQHK